MANAKDVLAQAKGLSLLYVEDDARLRDDTTRLLSTFFEEIRLASDGEEGFAMYRSARPDIVITDITMPRMTGLEMIRAIRERDRAQPIIVTSAHDEPAITQELEANNVTNIVLKPLALQTFLTALSTACADARTIKSDVSSD